MSKRKYTTHAQKMLDSDFGLHIIKEYEQVKTEILKFNVNYQRMLERHRQKIIETSIKQFGYWPSEIIIINEENEVVDGQHRLRAAIACNIENVPICKVSFLTKELEAAFFYHKNNYNTKLKPRDYWHARYLAAETIAKLIYQIESDPDSLFCNRIAIKGKETMKAKFSIPDCLCLLHTVLRHQAVPWRLENDKQLSQSVTSADYREIMARCNIFLVWFFEAFGDNKRLNPIPYRSDGIRSIASLYIVLKEQNFFEKGIKISARKMSSFPFNNDFIRTPYLGKIHMLVNHFNSGRKTTRVIYTV